MRLRHYFYVEVEYEATVALEEVARAAASEFTERLAAGQVASAEALRRRGGKVVAGYCGEEAPFPPAVIDDERAEQLELSIDFYGDSL